MLFLKLVWCYVLNMIIVIVFDRFRLWLLGCIGRCMCCLFGKCLSSLVGRLCVFELNMN